MSSVTMTLTEVKPIWLLNGRMFFNGCIYTNKFSNQKKEFVSFKISNGKSGETEVKVKFYGMQ